MGCSIKLGTGDPLQVSRTRHPGTSPTMMQARSAIVKIHRVLLLLPILLATQARADAYTDVEQLLATQQRLDAAQTTFTRLTEDYPELPEPYNNLAVLLAGQGLLEPARAALEMAIRVKPDYGTAQENLGDVYLRLAEQSYGQAQAADPDNSALTSKRTLTRGLLTSTLKNTP